MRKQTGYLFHRGPSWFVRYCDDVMIDGQIQRKLVCRKLDVPYAPPYKTKASVQPYVDAILAPINAGTINPQSGMTLESFVDDVYFAQWAESNLRTCTVNGYKHLWNHHLKPRVGKIALRDFRTVHGEKLLADIARQGQLGKNSLRHIKAFLSGVFRQAKRLGILDGVNPIMDVSLPRTPEADETHAVSLAELQTMLFVLDSPAKTEAETAARQTARTVILTAALTGLRKSEIRGLRWRDFDGQSLSVNRSVWQSEVNETKTRRSKAPVPVVKMLADALHSLRTQQGKLAALDAPIFQAGNGKPLNLDNLARRVIVSALDGTKVSWHGWHSFRRGLATTLHALGVDDKTIQAILRHSNIGVTMNIYVKSLAESQVNAMDALNAQLNTLAKTQTDETCNDLATQQKQLVN